MKKKVQLATVIKIKETIEKLILSYQQDIEKYNNTEIKIDKLLENIKQAEEALIPIKELVQESNKLKHSDGKTNNYYIYTLSNLNCERVFLLGLKDKTTDKSQLTKEEINKRLTEITQEIGEIKAKLAEFNSKEVTVELTEGLVQLGINL